MEITVVLFDENGKNVFICEQADAYVLPKFETAPFHIAVTEPLVAYVSRNYKLAIHVYCCFESSVATRIYSGEVLENAGEPPYQGKWLPLSQLGRLSHADQQMINSFKEKQAALGCPPWYQPGWRKEVETWVEEHVALPLLTSNQVRSWEKAALLQLHTEQETYYVKEVPSVFEHEVTLQSFLTDYFPNCTPGVVAFEPSQNRYLMREMKGELLGRTQQLGPWEEAIDRMADIQTTMAAHINHLLQLHLPYRPIVQTLEQKAEETMTVLHQEEWLNDEAYQLLRHSLSDMLRFTAELGDSHVPITLEHGDLFGGNIIVEKQGPIIYDWADSSLSHPFLSVGVLMEEMKESFSLNEMEWLLDRYLTRWKQVDTLENLREEYKLVQTLAPLFYLVVHTTTVFPGLTEKIDKQQIITAYVAKWKQALERAH
ncbi:phosphotransferase [Salsuginibacillus kocurii]|uniref:phosphotransferase n=1 Tax=Salsuginibacillus kocurii TaxID=427078 RepID=UPI00036FFCFD|nr:phosphotransferase [Salsuginibacillus kocurii]